MSQDQATNRGKLITAAVNTIFTGNVAEREGAISHLLNVNDHLKGRNSPEALQEVIRQMVYHNPHKAAPAPAKPAEVQLTNVDGKCNCVLYPNGETKPCNVCSSQSSGLRNYGKVKHVRTGGIYEVNGVGKLQSTYPLGDMADVYVYTGEDGKIWVRPRSEFIDGRFEDLLGDHAKPYEPTEDDIRRQFLNTRLPVNIRSGGVIHYKGVTLHGVLWRLHRLHQESLDRNGKYDRHEDKVRPGDNSPPGYDDYLRKSLSEEGSMPQPVMTTVDIVKGSQALVDWLVTDGGHLTTFVSNGANGMTSNDLGDRAEIVGGEIWQAVPEGDLVAIEKWIKDKGAFNASFFPVDAHRLANMMMHLIREVRALREGGGITMHASPSAHKFAQDFLDRAATYGKEVVVKDGQLGLVDIETPQQPNPETPQP